MAEIGKVIGFKGDLAIIEMKRLEACAKCRACIAGMEGKSMFIEAENACNAEVDDWVEVELTPRGFMTAVLVMYGIPFVGFMIGVALGYVVVAPLVASFMNRDLATCLVGILGALIAFGWIRSQKERWNKKKYRPIAVRLTTEAE
ncbi:MAG: SoxR reducing system RseC family protein [Clostridia bacterium]|jgi:sigma-E factor negative regulatory protein RseC|nr:SoxR reducing system RseC family protein [Clostridia bacterium]MCI2000786.1 SoxR reducing system RseC family protein [Clostridia bacterium]MCI2015422.1 SoxR reducing system RseC family protein [Clostridia bacterium]